MIETVQTALLDALQQQFPDYDVEVPESLRRYEFLDPDAAILVVLRNAGWGESPVLASTSRPVLPEFALMSLTHGHHAEPGAIEVLRGIEDAVELLEVPGTGPHPGGAIKIKDQFYDSELPGGGVVYVTLVQLTRDT